MIARTRQSVLDKQTFAEHVLAETDDNVCSSCTPNKQLDVDTCFPMENGKGQQSAKGTKVEAPKWMFMALPHAQVGTSAI
eukprot:1155918-Pelagomonas_calceolata.AAC.8